MFFRWIFLISIEKTDYIPLFHLITKGKVVLRTEALVDSGANISVFSSDISDYLGLKLTKSKRIFLQGVGGRIIGNIHKVRISVGEISFVCPIVFSAELLTSFNILGRDGFFTRFMITFDEIKNRLSLKPITIKKHK